MKIEEGKYYRTESGDKVGPMKPSGYPDWPWIFVVGDYQAWGDDGTGVSGTSSPDLIAEWTDEPRPWKDLTPEEKGALLLAHHEGGQLQRYCKFRDEWVDSSLEAGEQHTYRINPEPKRETVTLYGDTFYDFSDVEGCYPEYRITFDLVDGVPDCTSIKMEEV